MSIFDERAAEWDSNPSRRAMTIALADAMVASLAPTGRETVLDLGAGTGVLALTLRSRVARVIAADSSRGMLDVLQSKVASLGTSGIDTLLLDLERDDVAPPAVDVVVSTMMLHHVKDVGRLARRIFDFLKVGGRIALADLETESGDFHDDNTGVQHFGFDAKELAALFSAAGFANIQVRTAYVFKKERSAGMKDYPILLLTGEKGRA